MKSFFTSVVIFIIAFNVLSTLRESSMLDEQQYEEIKVHTLPTLMGETVTLAAKEKITVIYFFAPWCNVCHLSIDNLQNIYLKNQNIEVIAVALDYENIEEVKEFNKSHQLTFPIALGSYAIKHDFKIAGYPSYYVLDKNNKLVSKSMGYSTELGFYLRTM